MPAALVGAIATIWSVTSLHMHQIYALKQKFGHADDLNDRSVQLPRTYVQGEGALLS